MNQTINPQQLPIGFSDPYEFCEAVRPMVAERIDIGDWGFLSIVELRRALFSTAGWRLTKTGTELLSGIFQPYVTKNDENTIVTGKVLLGMDKCCRSPWFLSGKMITVFDSHLHLEIQIVGGNIADFIDFKSPKS